MAITFATKTTLTDQVCSPTKATASFDTVTGCFYLVSISASSDDTVTNVTSTNNVTFTVINSRDNGGKYLSVWGGPCTADASGTITVTTSGNCVISVSVDEVAGGASSSQVVQSVTAAAKTVTLAALASGSATYLAGRNALAMTIEAGWTALTNVGSTSRLLTGYLVAGDTTPSWTGTSATTSIIGVELAALAVEVLPSTMPMTGYGP